MEITKGTRVRFGARGEVPCHGQVTGKDGDGVKVRIGGTNREVTVPLDHIRPANVTGREVLSEVGRAHRLVLLGCPAHGLDAAESVEQHHQATQQRFNVVFIEGYPYDRINGVDDGKMVANAEKKGSTWPALVKKRLEFLAKLRQTCDLVVGLETPETAGGDGATDAELERFGQDARCTVANLEWAKLVKRHLPDNGVGVLCCGTAHLVPMQEKVLAPPIQDALHGAGVDLRAPAYAVADSDTGMYKPRGSPSGYLVSFPPIERGDDRVVYESGSGSSSSSNSDTE